MQDNIIEMSNSRQAFVLHVHWKQSVVFNNYFITIIVNQLGKSSLLILYAIFNHYIIAK